MDNIFITNDGYVYKDITQQAKEMTAIELEMYEVWEDEHGIGSHALIETMSSLNEALLAEHTITIELGTVATLFEKIDTFKRTRILADGMVVEIINHEPESVCFLVDGQSFWMDVYVSGGDITCEWNMYIFNTNNSRDIRTQELHSLYYDELSSLAISFLEDVCHIEQDENGAWFKVKYPNLKK